MTKILAQIEAASFFWMGLKKAWAKKDTAESWNSSK